MTCPSGHLPSQLVENVPPPCSKRQRTSVDELYEVSSVEGFRDGTQQVSHRCSVTLINTNVNLPNFNFKFLVSVIGIEFTRCRYTLVTDGINCRLLSCK